MIGVSVPNREIAEFESAIKDGSLLMMVEVDDDERDAIKHIITGRHPNVVFGGESEGLSSAIGQ